MVMFEEYVNTLTDSVTESAAATFTSKEVKLPTQKATNLAFCIHKISYWHTPWSDAPAHGDRMMMQLYYTNQTTLASWSNTNLIDGVEVHFAALTSGSWVSIFPIEHTFAKPILLGKDTMYIGVQNTGHTSAITFTVKLWYTLRKVSAFKMLETLVQQ